MYDDDTWQIIEVSESVLDPENGITETECLITICPEHGNDIEDAETFSMPVEEVKFWEKQIGKTFKMTWKIHKGFDKDANPLLDLDCLRKYLKQTFIFR